MGREDSNPHLPASRQRNADRKTFCRAVETYALISCERPKLRTIICRESHRQSRVPRKRLRWPRESRKIRSLCGQLLQLRSLTDGSEGTIRECKFSYSIIKDLLAEQSRPELPIGL
jgi:hypothetical protein